MDDGPESNLTSSAVKKKTAENSKSVEQVCIQIKRSINLFDDFLNKNFEISSSKS